jgi:hypothetical protein
MEVTVSKHLVAEWENNSYQDSDFYCAYYDTEDNKVHSVEIGSTRYAGGIRFPEGIQELTAETASLARQWLENRWNHVLLTRAQFDNEKPDKVSKGDAVIVIEKHTNRKVTEVCLDCDGTGEWVNPNRANDIRVCFKCNGKGHNSGDKASIKIPIGTTGEIVSSSIKYSSSYTKDPGRYDYDCLVALGDKVVRIPLAKLSRNEEIDKEGIKKKATLLADNANFGSMFILANVAWLSVNYLASFNK